MKDLTSVILMLIPAVLCFVGAAYLAATGKDGWGWFLFIGLLCMPSSVKIT